MIKNTLKNFFQNIVYLFIPMGIFYLFLLITIFGVFAAVTSELGSTLSSITELIHLSAEQSSVSVNDFLSYSLGQLDWESGLLAVVRQILRTGWIGETLRGFFATLDATTEGFEEEFTALIDHFIGSLKAQAAIAVAMSSLGLALANYATRFAVRRHTVKRGLKKFLIAHTVVPIVQSVFVLVAVGVLLLLRLYSLPLFLGIAILTGVLSFLSSWLVHRDKGLRLRDVLTAQNILGYLAARGILFGIDLVLVVLLYLISPILAVLLMVPIVLYTMNVADVDTDSFLCRLAEQTPAEAQKKPIEPDRP